MYRSRNRARIATILAVGIAVLLLSGCAAEANNAGAIISISPIADLATGFLQGLFILVVLVFQIVAGLASGFSTDAYQQDRGIWYQIGFLIGLLLLIFGPIWFLRFGKRRAR